MKEKVDDILAGFLQLTAAQFYNVLSYYYSCQAEIDADIEAGELPALLKQFNLEVNADGVLSPKN
jgi:hypothetical protein